MAAAATTSSQASANDSIITVNTMSDISSLAPSQFSFDNQENTNPKPKATRSRKPRVVKPKISEEDRELIASVSKRNKHIDMHAHDDMTLLFSAQKERLQFSIKKKLHESTSKRVDTSPILSPRDAQVSTAIGVLILYSLTVPFSFPYRQTLMLLIRVDHTIRASIRLVDVVICSTKFLHGESRMILLCKHFH